MAGHKQRPWQPLRHHPVSETNPVMVNAHRAEWEHVEGGVDVEVWSSDLYSVVVVRGRLTGQAYLSIKRNDRHVIRDWRHLQQIKNEIVGPEAEAIELFPAEPRLVDQANQYHLWCRPAGDPWPIGFPQRDVSTPQEMRQWNEEHGGRGRQREWQPGLTTGVAS